MAHEGGWTAQVDGRREGHRRRSESEQQVPMSISSGVCRALWPNGSYKKKGSIVTLTRAEAQTPGVVELLRSVREGGLPVFWADQRMRWVHVVHGAVERTR